MATSKAVTQPGAQTLPVQLRSLGREGSPSNNCHQPNEGGTRTRHAHPFHVDMDSFCVFGEHVGLCQVRPYRRRVTDRVLGGGLALLLQICHRLDSNKGRRVRPGYSGACGTRGGRFGLGH